MESSSGQEVYMKTESGECFKSKVTSTQASKVVELTSHQFKIATDTVEQTKSILGQLIQKFKQFNMDGKMFNLNKKKSEVLLKAVQSGIKFKFQTSPEYKKIFAYVKPSDKTHTVYLCPRFFKRNDEKPLSQDSKIGTLIHEVSHFEDVLETDDYDKDVYIKQLKMQNSKSGQFFPIQMKNLAIIGRMERQSNQEDNRLSEYEERASDMTDYNYEKFLYDANNLEYEIEFRYNHDGEYEEDVWQCCNKSEYISICQIKCKYMWEADKGFFGTSAPHWGLYHCGEQEECKHEGYPYCTCESSCNKKEWTCCRSKDFNNGYGCKKKYEHNEILEAWSPHSIRGHIPDDD